MYFINPLTHKLNKEDTMRGRSQSLNKTNQRRLEGFALIRCFDRLEQAHQHVGVRTTFLQSEYRSFKWITRLQKWILHVCNALD